MKPTIKVLILDDSIVFREVIARGISSDPQIVVVAKAENPYDAAEKITEFKPDVITCDVEMPKMNGIEFIRQLLPQHPIPIIVVSAINNAVFDAMNAGAVEFVSKPNVQSAQSVELFIVDLIEKIKAAYHAQVISQPLVTQQVQQSDVLQNTNRVIAIGASTGGTEAVFALLKTLPKGMPGILVVQHIPPGFSRMFADRLNSQTHFTVVEGKDGDWVEPDKVIVAPGDQHMGIRKVGDKYKVTVFSSEKVNGHCPSVDVLFESMAKECKDKGIGVILTGMGYDGAKGLLSMRRKGAKTIGQDEGSCVVYGMPKVAFEVGAVEKQMPLSKIASGICNLLK